VRNRDYERESKKRLASSGDTQCALRESKARKRAHAQNGKKSDTYRERKRTRARTKDRERERERRMVKEKKRG
jgi:hypothetical protein